MSHQPRDERQLNPHTNRIHETWVSIRKSELRPLQFNLAHGLVLITGCAIVFAMFRGCLNNSRHEQSVALRVQKRGGSVTWESRGLQGKEFITAVNLSGRGVGGVDAKLLQDIMELPQLRELYLANGLLFDGDILRIKPPPRLARIQLDNNQITDVAVRHIAQFPGLEAIDLKGCPITDASLRSLSQTPSLWHIRVDDTAVTDAGLQSLSQSKRLRILGLNGTQITDAGLRYLQDLDTLVRLEVARTSVTEEAVERLNMVLPRRPASR